ncbi:MAG TPA: hotdog fold thioesterase [Lapillicoccus sp.]|jgi:1,4-dihydroxy-2-naphthoyl-CoA hydrolase|nr:hotdog fold thioesterase [Lapillicoccus sp.]
MADTDTRTPWFTVDELNANGGALAERMGIHFTEATLERVVATMPVEGNTQPYGILHGGASVVLAESVGSMLSVLYAGAGRAAVGMTINAIHHRPASSGTVTATATLIQAGRTTASVAIAISDDEGRRVCSCTLLCQLRDAAPVERR